MAKIYLLIFFFLASIACRAQDANIYTIYEKQYQQLLKLRGVSDTEISGLLKKFAYSKVSNDSSLAAVFKQLYSSERGIALLFYFFNNDTLRRALYYPGKVVEVKSIAIKKENLLQLGEDINASLNLYALSNNRMPQTRGLVPLKSSGKKISYSKAIDNAASLLLPQELDSSIKHLLIVPALNIGTIPFHLLPFKEKELIEQCSFTIVPSLIDLVALRSKILKQSTEEWDGKTLPDDFDNLPEFAAIDTVRFPLNTVLLVSNPAYPQDSIFNFPNLPGAEKEVEAAIPYSKKYYLLRGDKATKGKVQQYMLGSDLTWFATHGIADQEDPMGKSFLVLSGYSPYLTAREIMSMRTYSRPLPVMVILSACQTGLGRSMESGTAGLARSFLLGGSSHVIMSLWNVDDKATSYLMQRYMYHLQQPHRFMPAQPLRLAILDTKKKFKNPAKWASFSLFGIDY